MQTAKVFMNGQSQAVRLPKEFRVNGNQVYIKKEGNLIILIPQDSIWESFSESLKEFSEDCFSEDAVKLSPDSRESFE